MPAEKSGFTLIELSIVLIIIGLVTGAILVGQDLVRAAETHSIIGQIEGYKAAINTFRVKYNALPGDMPDATDYWGTDVNCPNTVYDGVPKTATCNGNGNGLIGNSLTPDVYENQRFWQHLANAGLIEGAYTGVRSTGAYTWCSSFPSSAPMLKAQPKAGINLYGTMNMMGADLVPLNPPNPEFLNSTTAFYDTVFFIGKSTAGDDPQNSSGRGALFTSQQVYSIDSKIDDGMPYTGMIRISAYPSDGIANCATAQSLTATYILNTSGINCDILWDEKL